MTSLARLMSSPLLVKIAGKAASFLHKNCQISNKGILLKDESFGIPYIILNGDLRRLSNFQYMFRGKGLQLLIHKESLSMSLFMQLCFSTHLLSLLSFEHATLRPVTCAAKQLANQRERCSLWTCCQ